MVTEALNNSGVPQLSKIAADAIIPKELEDFFENTEVGLKKIESVIDSPYFIDFIEKMYSDYAGFLEILSYIDFNPIKNYDLKSLHQIAALMEQSEKYEILHYGMEKAQNNSKILCKSKEFLRKVNK